MKKLIKNNQIAPCRQKNFIGLSLKTKSTILTSPKTMWNILLLYAWWKIQFVDFNNKMFVMNDDSRLELMADLSWWQAFSIVHYYFGECFIRRISACWVAYSYSNERWVIYLVLLYGKCWYSLCSLPTIHCLYGVTTKIAN